MFKEGNRLFWILGSVGDICLLFLVIQLCCFQHVRCEFRAGVMKSTQFERLHKKGLIDNSNPLSIKTARSLLTCADFCTKETGCFSFDFGKSLQQCRLFNLNSADVVVTANDEFAVYTIYPTEFDTLIRG